jgi:hypothetical protein
MAALLAGVLLSAVAAHATDGTWLSAPATNDWNTFHELVFQPYRAR